MTNFYRCASLEMCIRIFIEVLKAASKIEIKMCAQEN